ncbi:MAG TPA: radical SAM protein [Elusimicrobiales bacterium]|nr:radical SAM protein [Elusimicrobiales bacterium]HOL62636.1 radical SAM protein [Elusimicrobiales bacterium]HPO95407.1 radical SAM protein [Elusimicrobiales bacterium]
MKAFIISANKRCDSNSADVSVIIKHLKSNLIEITDTPDKADIIVISTCGSVIETKKYSIDLIKSTAERFPNKKIIIFGCLSKIDYQTIKELTSTNPDIKIAKELADMDKILKTEKKITDIEEREFDENIYAVLKNDPVKIYPFAYRVIKFITNFKIPLRLKKKLEIILHAKRANILIGNGCAGNCSYCLIKISRKNPRSRTEQEIIRDIEKYKNSGKIINLTGDDCASWGEDIGKTLPDLLLTLKKEFPDIKFELRYLNPQRILENPKDYKKVLSDPNINSINICIQSGSNKILKLMNRNYEIEKALNFVKEIKKENPNIIIRTHIITGYPQSNFKDFILTLKAIKNFDMINTFIYSPRGYERNLSSAIKGKMESFIISIYNILKLFTS